MFSVTNQHYKSVSLHHTPARAEWMCWRGEETPNAGQEAKIEPANWIYSRHALPFQQ